MNAFARRSNMVRGPCPLDVSAWKVVGSAAVMMSGSMKIVPENGGGFGAGVFGVFGEPGEPGESGETGASLAPHPAIPRANKPALSSVIRQTLPCAAPYVHAYQLPSTCPQPRSDSIASRRL